MAQFRQAGLRARPGKAIVSHDGYFREVLDAVSAAIYITGAAGVMTYNNEAEAELWGRYPEFGTSRSCGSWKLYWPDGKPLPHDQSPMAIALKEKRSVRGVEAVAERLDGMRVPVIPYPPRSTKSPARFWARSTC